jgi:hypothetical protein
MSRKPLVIAAASVVLLAGAAAAVTYALGGTRSTTALDAYSTVTVDGHKALAKNIVAGRIESRYHPLPWLGSRVTAVRCPTGLKAVKGAAVTCTAESGSKRVTIPVRVLEADATAVTWKFER